MSTPVPHVDLESMWSNWAGNRALRYLFGDSRWLALHLSDPGTGDTATEVAGAGYGRRLTHWSMPSGKAVANISTPVFTAMPLCLVTWLAAWTAQSSGNMIAKMQLATPLAVPEDGQVRMGMHDLAWQI